MVALLTVVLSLFDWVAVAQQQHCLQIPDLLIAFVTLIRAAPSLALSSLSLLVNGSRPTPLTSQLKYCGSACFSQSNQPRAGFEGFFLIFTSLLSDEAQNMNSNVATMLRLFLKCYSSATAVQVLLLTWQRFPPSLMLSCSCSKPVRGWGTDKPVCLVSLTFHVWLIVVTTVAVLCSFLTLTFVLSSEWVSLACQSSMSTAKRFVWISTPWKTIPSLLAVVWWVFLACVCSVCESSTRKCLLEYPLHWDLFLPYTDVICTVSLACLWDTVRLRSPHVNLHATHGCNIACPARSTCSSQHRCYL